MKVARVKNTYRLRGPWCDLDAANRFLAHLAARAFSPATIRAYAFDLLNFARFCLERDIGLDDAVPTDIFEWVEWQGAGRRPAKGNVVKLTQHAGAAPGTVNRRVAAVRALFEHQVMLGARDDNPVPVPRRGQALRPKVRGMLGHLGPGRPRSGGRLVRERKRLPEAIDPGEVAEFVADLRTHRDRAIALAMVLGGLRASEVRTLRLADVDQGLRRVRVVGKGGRERVVPIERTFFVELATYLRVERGPGLATPECFVVLRGPTAGQPMTEAGLRRIFRYHRETSGARRACVHIACVTLMGPSLPPPASTSWCCAS